MEDVAEKETHSTEPTIVRNQDDSSLVSTKSNCEGSDGREIEVCGRLVEKAEEFRSDDASSQFSFRFSNATGGRIKVYSQKWRRSKDHQRKC